MSHADLLKRLLPPVAYDPNGALISAELAADGRALDAVQTSAELILTEADPRTTYYLLPDWERVLGLPDGCSAADGAVTVSQRRTRVVEKYFSRGGQSRQFFLGLAAKLGYADCTVTEFRPMTCEDPCDSVVYGEDWRFAWQLDIGDYIAVHRMTCEDACDSPLMSWQSNELLCRINQLKPAHTVALLNWMMTQEYIDVMEAYGRDDLIYAAPIFNELVNTTLPSAGF